MEAFKLASPTVSDYSDPYFLTLYVLKSCEGSFGTDVASISFYASMLLKLENLEDAEKYIAYGVAATLKLGSLDSVSASRRLQLAFDELPLDKFPPVVGAAVRRASIINRAYLEIPSMSAAENAEISELHTAARAPAEASTPLGAFGCFQPHGSVVLHGAKKTWDVYKKHSPVLKSGAGILSILNTLAEKEDVTMNCAPSNICSLCSKPMRHDNRYAFVIIKLTACAKYDF